MGFCLIPASGVERSRILAEKLLQLRIELWVFCAKLAWLLEERLGDDGKELGRIGRTVSVDQRAVVVLNISHQLIEVVSQDSRPRDIHGTPGKNGCAFAPVSLLVELVRELVENDIMSVVNVGST